jgi:hypothetical protein
VHAKAYDIVAYVTDVEELHVGMEELSVQESLDKQGETHADVMDIAEMAEMENEKQKLPARRQK